MLTLELLDLAKNISLIELHVCVFDKNGLDMGIRGGLGFRYFTAMV